jgi:hypothetical protein
VFFVTIVTQIYKKVEIRQEIEKLRQMKVNANLAWKIQGMDSTTLPRLALALTATVFEDPAYSDIRGLFNTRLI